MGRGDEGILDGSALDVHVRLANRKWVNIIRLEVTETVIDETVCGFVRAHGIKDVLYHRVFRKTPVVFGDRRCGHLLPVCRQILQYSLVNTARHREEEHLPFGKAAPFELLNCMRIRHHGLLLEVTDETVASSRGNEIREDSMGECVSVIAWGLVRGVDKNVQNML
jgi:hypothetical protein